MHVCQDEVLVVVNATSGQGLQDAFLHFSIGLRMLADDLASRLAFWR